MQTTAVSRALRERLGHEASLGLIDILETSSIETGERVLIAASDRFERRLTQEVSSLRAELHEGLAAVRGEIATSRVELLKWSFLFWVGQVAAVAGLLAFMLRSSTR